MRKTLAYLFVFLAVVACRHVTDDPITAGAVKGASKIPEVAMSDDNFSTFVKLINAAGLVDTLNGHGPFTVFAPTDAAFAKLPSGTVDSLLQPENRSKLRSILMRHIVRGRWSSAKISKMKTAETEAGTPLMVMSMGDGVMVGNANIIKADILASNGVIHAVDAVLLEPGAM